MRFLILAVSYKHGGLCVAGVDYDTLQYVRIGKERANDVDCYPLSEADLRFQNRTLRICDLVDIDAVKMPTIGCQRENYKLVKINKFIKALTPADIWWTYSQTQHTKYVFLNCNKTLPGENRESITSSIGFFKVSGMRLEVNNDKNGTPKYRTCFTYNGNMYRDFSLTDCAVCDYPHTLYGGRPLVDIANRTAIIGDAFIMVTLPPNPWEVDDCFYKYVSGVIVCDNKSELERKVGLTIEKSYGARAQSNSVSRVVELHDTVIISIDGETEQVYIGENSRKWKPVWTGENDNRVAYQSELISAGNPAEGFISNESPLAKAILGKSEGALFSYIVNGKKIEGEIIKIL